MKGLLPNPIDFLYTVFLMSSVLTFVTLCYLVLEQVASTHTEDVVQGAFAGSFLVALGTIVYLLFRMFRAEGRAR